MSDHVVVVGAGYAGAGAVRSFERAAPADADLTWISEHDYHLVLHEVHRVIRDPSVAPKIRLPVEEIKSPSTEFVEGRVEGVDVDERAVALADGSTVEYDYLLIALGSATAFYGIEGLRKHSLTLKSLDDAEAINAAVREAAAGATRDDPAQVLVGGAGLSGIQAAGEIAGWRDDNRAPVEVTLVEGLDEVFPGNDPSVQAALRERLEAAGIDILTGEFISEVDEGTVYLGGGEDEEPEELPYDVLLWTGGITGQEEVADAGVEKDERSNRIHADRDFTTSDDRVFAIGDTALIRQDGDEVAPPTAQAAWQAAEVAGENLARAVRGEPLDTWTHEDKGTLISVGEEAVAHGVRMPVLGDLPVDTFGGAPAKFLKKAVAARWIRDVTSTGRAIRAWGDM
ncbi:MAG: NAD(P)/FAD-dependent oxidoreductase [Haloferacaceae archaeon]